MADRAVEHHELPGRLDEAHTTQLDDLERQDPRQGDQSRERATAYLDGLRGLAAFFVLVQHYIGSFTFNVHEFGFGQEGHYYIAALPFVRVIFSGGSAAVSVFFVLSGYVLSKNPLTLLKKNKQDACRRGLISAIVRRPIRLYVPPLVVTLVWGLLWHIPGLCTPGATVQPRENVFLEISRWVEMSWSFFNPFRIHSHTSWFLYSMVVWTIPIELKGSMLVYAICGLLSLHLSAFSMLGLAFAVVVLLNWAKWTMACFIAGIILAYIDIHNIDTDLMAKRLSQKGQRTLWNITFFVGFFLVSQPARPGHVEYSSEAIGYHYLTLLIPEAYHKDDWDQYYRFWHSWGSILLVYGTLRLPWLQHFLNRRPLKYLGKVSFMLYLTHLMVMGIAGDFVGRSLGQIGMGSPQSWFNNILYVPDFGPTAISTRFLACLTVMMSLCLLVADFGTRTLDTPSVKLGKKLVQRLGLDSSHRPARKPEEHTDRLSHPV